MGSSLGELANTEPTEPHIGRCRSQLRAGVQGRTRAETKHLSDTILTDPHDLAPFFVLAPRGGESSAAKSCDRLSPLQAGERRTLLRAGEGTSKRSSTGKPHRCRTKDCRAAGRAQYRGDYTTETPYHEQRFVFLSIRPKHLPPQNVHPFSDSCQHTPSLILSISHVIIDTSSSYDDHGPLFPGNHTKR